MTCAQGLLRLLWGGPKLECYGTVWSGCFFTTKSSNEPAFHIFLYRWPGLDKLDFQVHKAKSTKEKNECESVIGFCQAALVNDASRKDYQEILEPTVVFLGEYVFLLEMSLHVKTISHYVVTVVISVLIDLK